MKNFLDIDNFYKTPSVPGTYDVASLRNPDSFGNTVLYSGYFSSGAAVSVQRLESI